MSPEQMTLIRDTWRQGGPIADTAAALFYDRLFELDPDVRVLFRGTDMARQHTALVQAITAVVDGLDRFDKLVPNIEALGRRHNAYGVTDRHYDTVGKALLWTLEKGLGDAWTPEAADAWRDAYAAVAGIMRSAGRASATAPSPIRAA
ncbi:MAG: globin family protein [Gammaproteobacteria bacterium]|jgi:hemoglobin-like flavoprotein